MTCCTGQQTSRRVGNIMASEFPTRVLWWLAVLVIATALIGAGYLLGLTPTEPANPTPNPSSSSSSAPVTGSASSSSTPTTPVVVDRVPAGVTEAVSGFLDAWTTRKPSARKRALEQTAIPDLGELLMLTEPSNIPRDCNLVGEPVVEDQAPGAVLVRVPTSCADSLYLSLDETPGARFGWLVTAIGRERSWIQ